MPLYEYECKNCSIRFERIQKFSDEPVKECPECGGAVERILNAPAVQFKGTGWYVTDYARKSGVSSAKSNGSTSADSATKTDTSAASSTSADKPPTSSSATEKKK